ncbi:MAG: hypothetical protein HRF45_13910 [Fimbriimonadia bacterium]|jgi:hypothetical protein
MVDGTDYYTQIYPANRDYNNTTFEIKGVDEQGVRFGTTITSRTDAGTRCFWGRRN